VVQEDILAPDHTQETGIEEMIEGIKDLTAETEITGIGDLTVGHLAIPNDENPKLQVYSHFDITPNSYVFKVKSKFSSFSILK
jgi:hypothetical protein